MAEEKNPTKEDYQKILDLVKANDVGLTEIQLNNCSDSKAVVQPKLKLLKGMGNRTRNSITGKRPCFSREFGEFQYYYSI